MFPSIGLPNKIKNHKWNGVLLREPAHGDRHARDEAVERAARAIGIGNPAIGATRVGISATGEGCN